MAGREKVDQWWMIQASWAVVLAVRGSRQDALQAAKEYGRLDQFPNQDHPGLRVTSKTPEILAVLQRHPFYPDGNNLQFFYIDNDLYPITPGPLGRMVIDTE